MKLHGTTLGFCLLALAMVFAAASNLARAEEAGGGVAPKVLIDFGSPEAGKQVTPTKGLPEHSTVTVDQAGIALSFEPQKPTDGPHPGIHVTPATGKSWDLSAYGHVEAKITNTSTQRFDIVMHVVDEGDNFWTEKKFEFAGFKPGETKVLKVIFGYQKGFKPGPEVKTASIKEIYIFVWDKAQARAFRIEELKAAGMPGEKPEVEPASTASQPATAPSTKP